MAKKMNPAAPARPAPRPRIGTRLAGVLYAGVLVGSIVTALAAVIVSWTGLLHVAGWQELPEDRLWATPVMIDVALIVCEFAYVVQKYRGNRSVLPRRLSVLLTVVSSGANFLHTVEARGGINDYTDFVGALLNGLAPWLILAMGEIIAGLIEKRVPAARGTAPASRKPSSRGKPSVRVVEPVPVLPSMVFVNGRQQQQPEGGDAA